MLIEKSVPFDNVRRYHGEAAAEQAAELFYRVVQRQELEDGEHVHVPLSGLSFPIRPVLLVDLCATIASSSKSEIRRWIQAGAVSINGARVNDIAFALERLEPGTKISRASARS